MDKVSCGPASAVAEWMVWGVAVRCRSQVDAVHRRRRAVVGGGGGGGGGGGVGGGVGGGTTSRGAVPRSLHIHTWESRVAFTDCTTPALQRLAGVTATRAARERERGENIFGCADLAEGRPKRLADTKKCPLSLSLAACGGRKIEDGR
jgi:hypothetical protein